MKIVLCTDKCQSKNAWGAKVVHTMKCRHFSSWQVKINLNKEEKILIQAGLMAWMTKLHRPNDVFWLHIALKLCCDPPESHRGDTRRTHYLIFSFQWLLKLSAYKNFFWGKHLRSFTDLHKMKGLLRTVHGQLLLSLFLYSSSTRRFLINYLPFSVLVHLVWDVLTLVAAYLGLLSGNSAFWASLL